jgi:predicted deacylase
MGAPARKFAINLHRLPAGFHRRRFTGRGVGFDAFIWRGGPGPVLLVNGATHGDEYEGPTALQLWAERWRPARLRGTVVMVPVLNEAAFFAGQRCHPGDGGNLARAFPGRRAGAPTARLAHLFDTGLLAQCTHYLDLHSAGAAYELKPWVGYITHRDRQIERAQQAMAACFDRFWCWAGPYLPGRTLSAAHDRSIPGIYVECQGAGGVAAEDLRALDAGLRRLLAKLGLAGAPRALRPQLRRITRDKDEAHLQVHHPAPYAGLFVPAVHVAQAVKKNFVLGRVLALDGKRTATILAERTGRIVLLRRQRSVQRGDALATLAPI